MRTETRCGPETWAHSGVTPQTQGFCRRAPACPAGAALSLCLKSKVGTMVMVEFPLMERRRGGWRKRREG